MNQDASLIAPAPNTSNRFGPVTGLDAEASTSSTSVLSKWLEPSKPPTTSSEESRPKTDASASFVRIPEEFPGSSPKNETKTMACSFFKSPGPFSSGGEKKKKPYGVPKWGRKSHEYLGSRVSGGTAAAPCAHAGAWPQRWIRPKHCFWHPEAQAFQAKEWPNVCLFPYLKHLG